jgi:CheY-like chemotaxis protein
MDVDLADSHPRAPNDWPVSRELVSGVTSDSVSILNSAPRATIRIGASEPGSQARPDFPELTLRPDARTEANVTATSRRDTTVLVACTAPLVRRLLGTDLRAAGYRVLDAADAATVQAQLDTGAVDVVVLDTAMASSVPGRRLVADLLAATARVPVVLLTSRRAGPRDPDAAGLFRHLVKPFRLADLLDHVAAAAAWRHGTDTAPVEGAQDDGRILRYPAQVAAELERLTAAAARGGQPLYVLVLDEENADHPRRAARHQLSPALEQQLRDAVRAGDLTAHWDQNTLLIALPDTDAYGADRVAQRVRELLHDPLSAGGPTRQRVTVHTRHGAGLPD